jgi:cell division protein FtsB
MKYADILLMRPFRYILVPWTMFFVYSFFTFFLGQNGVYAHRHLQAEQARLSENLEALQDSNAGYQKTKNNLAHDYDSISVYTRQLGYGRGDEEFIRIMGLAIAANSDLPAGQVFYSVNPVFISDTAIKFISAFFGMAILIFFLICDIPSSRIFNSLKTRMLSR